MTDSTSNKILKAIPGWLFIYFTTALKNQSIVNY